MKRGEKDIATASAVIYWGNGEFDHPLVEEEDREMRKRYTPSNTSHHPLLHRTYQDFNLDVSLVWGTTIRHSKSLREPVA
ncbi:hypothetical protein K440DRAFT_304257 [Wilcoxina mikolae CBS 423.85]|nr:hypothetical protein K440DRAFT_304257 [Wilcoxina mikolae CBS 423.85]